MTAYDAAYVTLARDVGARLVSLDADLITNARQLGVDAGGFGSDDLAGVRD